MGREIQHQAEHARGRDRAERSTYEEAVLQLDYMVTLYWRLRHSLHLDEPQGLASMIAEFERQVYPGMRDLRGMDESEVPQGFLETLHQSIVRYGVLNDFAQFAALPYRGGSEHLRGEWVSLGEGFQRSLQADALHPVVFAYRDILLAWESGDVASFNRSVRDLDAWMAGQFGVASHRAAFEADFNRMALFWKGAVLYVLIFLLVAVSWLTGPRLCRIAGGLAWLTWVAHTVGLCMRMYIQERPPVTSLHASAIFVGWVAVFLGLLVERRLRNGFGLAAAAAIGFSTLVIAHNLGGDGDSIEVMRAVLDSNFWLSTHVVVITIGYAAVYVAGALAIIYLIARQIPGIWTAGLRRSLSNAVTGVVGFALLFSFAGTVLGGFGRISPGVVSGAGIRKRMERC